MYVDSLRKTEGGELFMFERKVLYNGHIGRAADRNTPKRGERRNQVMRDKCINGPRHCE